MNEAITPGPIRREAVIKVGLGRGFVVDGGWRGPLVVTAGHCLPHLPPSYPVTTPRLAAGPGGNANPVVSCSGLEPTLATETATVAPAVAPPLSCYRFDRPASFPCLHSWAQSPSP